MNVLGFSTEAESIGCEYIYIYKEIYCEELAHRIMEAREPHHLPFASCQPRKLM